MREDEARRPDEQPERARDDLTDAKRAGVADDELFTAVLLLRWVVNCFIFVALDEN